MPAGYTITWVNQKNANFPHVKTGWQFVLDSELAQLGIDGVAYEVKAIPQRYLPQIKTGVAHEVKAIPQRYLPQIKTGVLTPVP